MYLKFSQLYPELYIYSEVQDTERREILIGIMTHAIMSNHSILIDFS